MKIFKRNITAYTIFSVIQMIGAVLLGARALYVHEKIICAWLTVQAFFGAIQVANIRDIDIKTFESDKNRPKDEKKN